MRRSTASNSVSDCGAEFDHQIPAAVGGVDGRDFRKAAQRADHPVGGMALDLDHHDAAHALVDRVGAQDDGVADDLAGLFQPLHAGPHGRARDAEIDRQIGDAAPRIVAQQV